MLSTDGVIVLAVSDEAAPRQRRHHQTRDAEPQTAIVAEAGIELGLATRW